MSNSYFAGQYDSEFNPKRLQMHQVPKPAQTLSKAPRKSSAELTFIANEKGHLLPGTRKSDSNPFGDYVGTWDMPKKIPGPYHLVRTGRTDKHLGKLYDKKLENDNLINQARENQKPLNLRKLEA